jgi:hypothetical protein
MTIMSVVFINDFCNGIADPLNQPRKGSEQQWVARASLHGIYGIYGIFPSPEVLQHEGGKDSISEKKQEKGDFTNHFPLPTLFTPDSLPGSWKLVTPLSGIISAVISLLQKTPDTSKDPTATIGNSGYAIPHLVTRTLASCTYKENPTAWNKSSCSWPLLNPSGKVNSTVANLLPLRSLRLCYKKSPGSWTVGGLVTLGAAFRDSPSWTHPSQT